MSDAIPSGKIAFLPTATGWCDARALPAAGVALRPNGEIMVIGGGEAFAARLTPAQMDDLAELLVMSAEARRRSTKAADPLSKQDTNA